MNRVAVTVAVKPGSALVVRTQNTTVLSTKRVVPAVGVEPTRGCPQRFLRPPRLPFRHAGTGRAQAYPQRLPLTGAGTEAPVVA